MIVRKISFISLFTLAFIVSIFGQSQEKFDYIFLIDCSGSMVGLPKGSGNVVIFPQVKETIKDFLRDIAPGANVTIMPFHRDVQDEYSKIIINDKDIQEIEEYIDNLKAEGQVTWIYYSIRTALKKAQEIRQKDNLKHTQMILLYTDGKDNGPQDLDLDGILNYFKMQRGENEFLYLKYITLGVDLDPQEELKLTRTDGVQLIKNPKGELSKRFPVEIRPYVLDFGNFLDKDENSRKITTQCDDQIRTKEIYIKPIFEELDNLGVAYTISPEKSQLEKVININLRLFNKDSLLTLEQKKFEGKIIITGDETLLISPQIINVHFSVQPKKVITIKSKDGQRLFRDFGRVEFTQKGLYEQKWPLIIAYNEYALKERVPLKLKIKGSDNNPSLLAPEFAYFEVDEKEKGQEFSVDQNANVDLVLKIAKGKLKKGSYQGNVIFSATEDTDLEGDGLEINQFNKIERLATFSFYVPPAPLPWKIIIPLVGFLFVIIVIGLNNPSFYKGSILEDEAGGLVALKKKFFKRKYTVAGYGADFVLPNLPSTIKFYIKPAGRGSRYILIKPKKRHTLKNSDGIEMSSAFWTTLEPDGFVQGDDINPIKIYYKILGEE